ncbi:AAA family ATPase [Clostridium sp. LQ25]|uniref:AAA family ATPase n=1 Tax=Clostridium sp. LQ25 TaxID=2992805 RepID=UPI002254EB53|nr:AAA family ATPase [Clostridium sp. LQ25]MDU5722169.1 AAA family ATPase [Clostridium butyricum]MDU5820390.1 AAA family ATPase [Clostridium butyricum]UZT06124.1 AAA family ATPase [Clostridium sp. LQ25]
MIIWINGTFGVGKTTVSNELHKKLKDSFVYDPEKAGEFIWDNSPDCINHKDDFQNISMWRDFNYQMLKYIHENYSGTIIVPMTLVNKEYYSQIIGRLINEGISIHHYILLAERSTILSRLEERGASSNSWPAQQMDRCLPSLEKDIMGIRIKTDNLSIEEVTELILKKSCECTNP